MEYVFIILLVLLVLSIGAVWWVNRKPHHSRRAKMWRERMRRRDA